MTPDQFVRIGTALYGSGFREKLADELGVRHDTVRHWARGKSDINRSPGIITELRHMLAERKADIEALLNEDWENGTS